MDKRDPVALSAVSRCSAPGPAVCPAVGEKRRHQGAEAAAQQEEEGMSRSSSRRLA